MKVIFRNIEDEKIKQCFIKVVRRYEELHPYQITLRQGPIKSSTMQAQPVISWKGLFTGLKQYHVKLAINVRDSDEIKVADLSEKVLTGWFAHELGHIVDYGPYSNSQMIIYGIKYLLSDNFKREAEHKADFIAIKYGFHQEILATKKFLLENDFLGESYKNKINKYYMSMKDVEMCVENNSPLDPIMDL